MGFKRRPTQGQQDTANLKLVDELVRKSLAINPQLRQGKDTGEVLDTLRLDAIAKSGTAKSAEPKVSSDRGDPRLKTIEIFLRDKARTFPETTAVLRKQIDTLQQQLHGMKQDAIADILELVGLLLQTGMDANACRNTLAQYRDLLAQLEITEAALVDQARKKKK